MLDGARPPGSCLGSQVGRVGSSRTSQDCLPASHLKGQCLTGGCFSISWNRCLREGCCHSKTRPRLKDECSRRAVRAASNDWSMMLSSIRTTDPVGALPIGQSQQYLPPFPPCPFALVVRTEASRLMPPSKAGSKQESSDSDPLFPALQRNARHSDKRFHQGN